MEIPNNDKHRQYANYAAHCLTMGMAVDDPATRDIQRKMALEWLALADAVLRSTDGAVPNPSHLS
jgi:hypothetical protein